MTVHMSLKLFHNLLHLEDRIGMVCLKGVITPYKIWYDQDKSYGYSNKLNLEKLY